MVTDPKTQERYIGITAVKGSVELELSARNSLDLLNSGLQNYTKDLQDLIFIPYYLRGNRGGKGMMRVGLREMHM